MPVERIDMALCNGCQMCVDTCPMDVFRLDTLVVARNEFPPCRMVCPAGVDMRNYIYLVKEGMIEEAINVLRDDLPLPAVTGRICPHPCESECARKEVDEAVNINSLERFVADYWLKEKVQPIRKLYSAETAIIGSGPAGLSCAYFLAKAGYPVTVFEAMPVLGGMLRIGIPEYRLPRNVLDAQINYIRDMGVEFKTGITIGRDMTLEELKNDYQAIFFATGKPLSNRIELEGARREGVLWGLDFLRDFSLNQKTKVKDRVAVLGGGNVALVVALTALRLGAKEVQIACLESEDKMPAFQDEIRQAVDEGVRINASWGPKRILVDGGKVAGIELVRCISVFDGAGRFSPSFNEQEKKMINADMIILAIGQVPDLSLIPKGMKISQDSTIQIDPITLETNLPGIFAGGDVATKGSSTSVVEAISAGRRASVSIDRYLKGEDLKAGRFMKPDRVKKPPREGIQNMARQQTPELPVSQRGANFKEVKIGFNEDRAHLEAQRCMTCGSRAVIKYVEDCQLCLYCERDCPQKAIYVSPEKKEEPLLAWG